jgi:hypothetical protein
VVGKSLNLKPAAKEVASKLPVNPAAHDIDPILIDSPVGDDSFMFEDPVQLNRFGELPLSSQI